MHYMTEIILGMGTANERHCIIAPPIIGCMVPRMNPYIMVNWVNAMAAVSQASWITMLFTK